MILNFLRFIHVAFGLIAIGAGAALLLRMLTGEFLEKWAAVFLKSALAASVTGLLFPLHHLQPTHVAAMFGIYVSGAAVLAWRRFQLAGTWALTFALSIIILVAVSTFVAIAHAFRFVPVLRALAPTQSAPAFVVTEIVVILPLVALGVFAVCRFCSQPAHSSLGSKAIH